MLEIEAKFRVEDLAVVADRLRSLGARRVGRYIERNLIFDRHDGSLRAAGCGLRIRTVETLEGESVPPTLTYKGKVLGGEMKVREEIEVTIGDAEAMSVILHATGFRTVISFRKRRDRWLLDGSLIELDEVPLIGTFVEIEAESEEAVRAGQRRLGLGDRETINYSYVRMLIDRCRELNRPAMDIDFA